MLSNKNRKNFSFRIFGGNKTIKESIPAFNEAVHSRAVLQIRLEYNAKSLIRKLELRTCIPIMLKDEDYSNEW